MRKSTFALLGGLTALAITTSTTQIASASPEVSDQVAAPVTVQTHGFSGEDLFQGLVFGDGPVAQAHPELVPQVDLSAEQEAVVDDMLVQLHQQDARFFDRFAAGMQSGNPMLVQRAAQDAHVQLDSLVDTTSPSTDPMCVAVFIVAVAVLVTLALGVVSVAANVNAVANVTVTVNYRMPRLPQGSLVGERWVAEATRSLAA